MPHTTSKHLATTLLSATFLAIERLRTTCYLIKKERWLAFCTILLVLQLGCTDQLFGQDQVTLYLNSKWEVTTKEKAACSCLVEYNLDEFKLNGTVQCNTLNNRPLVILHYKNNLKDGKVTLFSSSGNMLFDGNYKNDDRVGVWKYYYPDGRPWQTIRFVNNDDSRHGSSNNIRVGEYYDKAGTQKVKNGTGQWTYDSVYYSMGEQTSLKMVTGGFRDSLKNGIWELIRLQDRKILARENFRKGQFVDGQFAIEPNGGSGEMPHEIMSKFPDHYASNFHNLEIFKLDHTVFDPSIAEMDVEPMLEAVTGIKYKVKNRNAGYRYGTNELMQVISKNIRYPQEARQRGLTGTVIVQVTIDRDGNAKDIKVLKGVHESLNQEALRVISAIKDWVPAINNGEPYEKVLGIPIRFAL